MKKLLMHICCAPCFIAPYKHLKDEFDLMGFWYNPNIHPYTEYQKRLQEVKRFEENHDVKIIYNDEYNLEKWLRNVVFREKQRCRFCYYDRLVKTAIYANHGNFDYFTSTLLYSKFQKQKLIRGMTKQVASQYSVKFFDKDLREYWKEGIQLSKEENMYRQQYCGCIYSEKDRYYKGK
ncbi:MAG: epoxyqueuosine reductase QueH [Candidatus Cloacimonetes bacterium]|nr:epoxyqueuosine reductase QueH [Candidatus Cloacimonadota bacterium]